MSKQRREKQKERAAAREAGPEFWSGINAEGKPFLQLSWAERRAQLTPDEAREMGRSAFATAEAAETDAMMFGWIAERMPALTLDQRAQFIAELRRYREAARALGEAERESIAEPVPLPKERLA